MTHRLPVQHMHKNASWPLHRVHQNPKLVESIRNYFYQNLNRLPPHHLPIIYPSMPLCPAAVILALPVHPTHQTPLWCKASALAISSAHKTSPSASSWFIPSVTSCFCLKSKMSPPIICKMATHLLYFSSHHLSPSDSAIKTTKAWVPVYQLPWL